MGSRGSIIPIFLKESKSGVLKITDKRMTRFNLSLNESAELVINCIRNSIGGEIFVPKIPSYRITDLANAIGPSCKKKIIGIRPGEKIHEEMITSSDSYSTYDVGNFFIILPANVAFSELSKVIATASAAEVILTAVAIMSFTSAFFSAESVASRIIMWSPATGVTAVSPDIPVAGNVLISVCA